MIRIHILGASGSGTSTLGVALAEKLGIAHFDSDNFYWMPTNPPFTTPREMPARIELLQEKARPDEGWILSGSALKWAMQMEPLYELIIFMRLDPVLRMERLRQREMRRYGDRILPGGDMADASRAFLEWAESYDTVGPEQRGLVAHEAWFLTQTAPILRLDSAEPLEALVDRVMSHTVVAGRLAS